MMAVECLGHECTVFKSISAAACGEAGSCGQNQTISGLCALSHCAMNCALKEFGLERKPCRYTKWLVGKAGSSEIAWVKKSLQLKWAMLGDLFSIN